MSSRPVLVDAAPLGHEFFAMSATRLSTLLRCAAPCQDGDPALRFADLLRRRRLRLGFTQAELAQRAMLSERTISDLERGLKLPQSANARRLASALQLSPLTEQLTTSRQRARQPVERPAVTTRPLPGHTLPVPRSTFIGREREGPWRRPGCWKPTACSPWSVQVRETRVALKLAESVSDRYADGAWFVGLAPVFDARLVVGTRRRAWRLYRRGWLAHVQRDSATANRLLTRALAEARDDVWWRAWVRRRWTPSRSSTTMRRALPRNWPAPLRHRRGAGRRLADRVGAALARTGRVHRRRVPHRRDALRTLPDAQARAGPSRRPVHGSST